MKISVRDIINSEYAVNYDDGMLLLETLQSTNLTGLTVSFEGVAHVSTLFLNESIGKLALINPSAIESITFDYPAGKPLFKSKLENVIENALMGDEYDELVNAAKMAL